MKNFNPKKHWPIWNKIVIVPGEKLLFSENVRWFTQFLKWRYHAPSWGTSDVLPLVVDYYISYRLLWSEFNYIKAHTCHGKKTLKIKKKLKFGFNFGPPYIFWSNDNMAALLKWDLSLTYSDSTVCLLTSKTKKTWTQNKKNWKNLGKFQAVFSQFLHFKWLQIL